MEVAINNNTLLIRDISISNSTLSRMVEWDMSIRVDLFIMGLVISNRDMDSSRCRGSSIIIEDVCWVFGMNIVFFVLLNLFFRNYGNLYQ